METLTRSGRKTEELQKQTQKCFKSNRRLPVRNITAKLNECKTKTFSQKTVQRVLHSEGYKRRLAKKEMVVREANQKSESSGVKSQEVGQ